MSLGEVRKRIEDIDRHIVELVSERLKLAEEIAKIKIREGLSGVDDLREVELKVLWRKYAASHSIPLALAEQILSTLLSYSKDAQFKVLANDVCNEYPRKCRAITIVGYDKMAQALGSLLVSKGYSVIVSSRDLDKAEALAKDIGSVASKLDNALVSSRYIVLALQPKEFEELFVNEIAKDLREKVVIDILLAKRGAYRRLEELSKTHQFHYVSAYPLFGPTTPAIGQKIVLIPSETGTMFIDEVVMLWRCAGLDTVVTSFEEHEKATAIVQVLTHLLILLFELSIDELSRKLNVNYVKFSTPTFKELLTTTVELSEMKDVMLELQRNNVFSSLVRKTVLEVLMKILSQLGDAL